VFLAYVANVLPSLGERSVDQRTLAELTMPRVEVTVTDADDAARLKGDLRMATVVARAVLARIRPPVEAVRIPLGTRTIVLEPATVAEWIARALAGTAPVHVRRQGLRTLVQRELQLLTGKDDVWAKAEPLRKALNAAWPTLRPIEVVQRLLRQPALLADAAAGLLTDDEQATLVSRGKRHAWSAADAVLVDEAAGLLDGPPRTWGHVVVDEAQDLSAMAFRAIGRRCPSGSATILGDLAQSTAPAGQRSWDEALAALGNPTDRAVEHLTIGYRVPAPVLEVANELLAHAEVSVPASRSARLAGDPPRRLQADDAGLATAAADALIDVRSRHPLSGVIAPEARLAALADALVARGLIPVDHLDHLGADEVPLLGAEAAKGLELDGVVAVDHEALVATGPRGARLAYIMLTRAVQELTLVSVTPTG
jgi:DNA helicase IV